MPLSSTCKRHTRSRKRREPSRPFSDQAIDASRGPMNISYRRKVSAPYWLTTSSGFTTFPLDLDIFSLPSPRIIPRSEEHTSELQSRFDLVCRLLLEKKNKINLILLN